MYQRIPRILKKNIEMQGLTLRHVYDKHRPDKFAFDYLKFSPQNMGLSALSFCSPKIKDINFFGNGINCDIRRDWLNENKIDSIDIKVNDKQFDRYQVPVFMFSSYLNYEREIPIYGVIRPPIEFKNNKLYFPGKDPNSKLLPIAHMLINGRAEKWLAVSEEYKAPDNKLSVKVFKHPERNADIRVTEHFEVVVNNRYHKIELPLP